MGGVFGDRQHDFAAEISILPLGPETRRTHAFNGIRWDFCYADDLDERGQPRQISMIWPEFIDEAGVSIPTGVPIEGRLHARMHIFVREAVDLHRQRLAIGGRFYCVEGSRKVAEGVVTSLSPMARRKRTGLLAMPEASKRLMEFQWGGVPYWSTAFEDNVGGCMGMELHRTTDGTTALVAKLTFWDATGQYWLETLGAELPLGVIDKLVTATRSLVGEAVIGPS